LQMSLDQQGRNRLVQQSPVSLGTGTIPAV
jgi:hypothetical protein